MLSQFASRTCWRSHKPAKPRIRGIKTRRHYCTEANPLPPPCNTHLYYIFLFPARPEEAEAVYAYFKAELHARWAPKPDIPDILKEVEDLLPMEPNHLAIESVFNIRAKLSSLIRTRKWRADALKATHPGEAEDIRLGNIKLEAVREHLEVHYV